VKRFLYEPFDPLMVTLTPLNGEGLKK